MLGRTIRRLPIVALLIALAAGGATVGSSPAGVATSTGAAQTLVVGRTADINTLDPHKATAFQTIQTLELVYGTLVQLNQKLELQPGLATSWRFSNNIRTLTFTLRPGVRFHDGSAFDSRDVAASLNRILDPATAAVGRANLTSIASIQTPNARTVVLGLSGPDVPIVAALADLNTAIMSSEDIASGAFVRTPNGTGPFRFANWTANESVRLTANPRFWARKIDLSAVEFRVIPDELSIVSAMRARNVHVGVVTDPIVARQSTGGGLRVVRMHSLNYHALMLNSRAGPLRDYRVRRAIACAIDRQEVLKTAALGEGRVVGPFTSPAFASNPSKRPCPKPNLALARRMLRDAGFPNGFTLRTIVGTGVYATAVNEAQSVQAQLRRIGVNLELEIMEFATYVRKWLAADFDAAMALNSGRVDPHTMYVRYFTSDGNLNKVAGYSSPILDSLFAAGRSTVVIKKRREIYDRIGKILEGNTAWVWLFSAFDYRVLAPNVRGFVAMPNGSLQYLRQVRLT